jgi:hypothetical protein
MDGRRCGSSSGQLFKVVARVASRTGRIDRCSWRYPRLNHIRQDRNSELGESCRGGRSDNGIQEGIDSCIVLQVTELLVVSVASWVGDGVLVCRAVRLVCHKNLQS